MTTNITANHNHQHCIDQALTQARELCNEQQLRLTRIREQVLTIIWLSHKPIGAYNILAQLSDHGERPPAPPTVYRALDFLLEHGLVHRIASLNAYIGCNEPAHRHDGHFLICQHCQVAIELESPQIDSAIAHAANSKQFQIDSQCVEVVGCCRECQQRGQTQ